MAKFFPDPKGIKPQRTIEDPTAGGISSGLSMTAAQTYTSTIAIAGTLKLVIRAKAAVAATLQAAFALSDGVTAAATGNPSNVTLTANTENIMTVNPSGEHYLIVSVVCGGSGGVLNYVDVAQLAESY